MFGKILLAYDGSDHARQALTIAAGMADTFGAELHVSHTPQVDTPRIVVGAFVGALEKPPTDEQIAEAGEHVVADARERADAAGITIAGVHIGRGDPAAQTLAAAEEIGADLIIMGRRGLGAVGALALGSVSQSVAHGAKCACMTVL